MRVHVELGMGRSWLDWEHSTVVVIVVASQSLDGKGRGNG